MGRTIAYALGEGLEEVARLHGLVVLLVVNELQAIVFRQGGADGLWHLEKDVFKRLRMGCGA